MITLEIKEVKISEKATINYSVKLHVIEDGRVLEKLDSCGFFSYKKKKKLKEVLEDYKNNPNAFDIIATEIYHPKYGVFDGKEKIKEDDIIIYPNLLLKSREFGFMKIGEHKVFYALRKK